MELVYSSGNTEFLYSPAGQELALMNGQSLQKAMIRLPGGGTAMYKTANATLDHYRHGDWLGSARLSSTPNRTCYYDVAYAPFGETYAPLICGGGNTSVAFAGQGKDTTTDLYPFLFREYNSIQSRWVWPDPAGRGAVSMENPQSWNRYAYVGNGPLNAVDPLGLAGPWDDVFGSARRPGGYGYSDLAVLDIFVDNLNSPATSPNLGALGTFTPPPNEPEGQVNTFQGNDISDVTYYAHNGWTFNPADDGGTPFGGGAANNSWGWTFTKSFFGRFKIFGPKKDPRNSCFGNFLKDSVANFVGIPGIDTVGAGAATYYGASLYTAQAVPSSRALRGGLSVKQWLRADEAASLTNAGKFSLALNAVVAEGQALANEVPSALAGECK